MHAQYNLGICYQNGIGINKNDRKAFDWYFKSARGEYLSAQNVLGDYYQNGIGIEKSFEKAIHWYNKAAENGHEKQR